MIDYKKYCQLITKVNPPNMDWHSSMSFREQIAIMVPINLNSKHITFLRTFVQVCAPGSASFDPECPGEDTSLAWQIMNNLIEQENVRGFFHTHPPELNYWSLQDIRAQNGLAKANGRLILWHGVQAAPLLFPNEENNSCSEFVCSWMEHGRVFRYNYGTIEDHLDSPIITLSMPPVLQWFKGAYVIES